MAHAPCCAARGDRGDDSGLRVLRRPVFGGGRRSETGQPSAHSSTSRASHPTRRPDNIRGLGNAPSCISLWMLPSDRDVTVINVGKSKNMGLTVAVAILLMTLNPQCLNAGVQQPQGHRHTRRPARQMRHQRYSFHPSPRARWLETSRATLSPSWRRSRASPV